MSKDVDWGTSDTAAPADDLSWGQNDRDAAQRALPAGVRASEGRSAPLSDPRRLDRTRADRIAEMDEATGAYDDPTRVLMRAPQPEPKPAGYRSVLEGVELPEPTGPAPQVQPPQTRMTEGRAARPNTAQDQGRMAGDRSFLERAAVKAATAGAEGMWGAVRAGAELVGADRLGELGKHSAQAAADFEQGMGKPAPSRDFNPRGPMPYLQEQAEGAATSLGQSAAYALAFGPRAVIPLLSMQSAGQQYQQARAAGLTPGAALANALPYGAFEAIGEKLGGLDKAAKALNTIAGGRATREQIKDAGEVLLRAGVKEIPSEWVTYLGQTGVDLLPGIGIRQDLTGEQFLEGLRDTTVQAAMMGTAMGTGGAVASTRATRRPPERTAEQIARQKGFLRQQEQIKELGTAGEKEVAATLQRRLDTQMAEDELAGLADRPYGSDPDFQNRYRELRVGGVKPGEAAARAAMATAYGQIGEHAGVNRKAFQKVVEAAAKLPLDKVPGFFERVTVNLAKQGLAQPVPAGTIEGAVGALRDDAIATALPDSPLATMSAIEELEQQDVPAALAAAPADAVSAPSDAGKPGSDAVSAVSDAQPAMPEFGGEDLTSNDHGAHQGASSPRNDRSATKAQILAGNAPLGRMVLAERTPGGRLDVSVENAAGSERIDLKNEPPKWRTPMANGYHYGYFRRSEGNDGDHVDGFIREGLPEDWAGDVFVVDQVNRDGSFDEHKVMAGPASEEEARADYLKHYEPGWTGAGAVTRMSMADFKGWLRDGKKTDPVGRLGAPAASASQADAPAAAAGARAAPDAGAGPAADDATDAPAAAVAQPLRLGITPNDAEPVTVRGGVVHIGEQPALDFDSGEPIALADDASDDQIRQALKEAGAVSRRMKFFGGQRAAATPATKPTRERNAELLAQQQDEARKDDGYRVAQDVREVLDRFKADPTFQNKDTEFTITVSGLGDVMVRLDPATGEATVSAEYLGKSYDERKAKGGPAIAAAIERARDGIQEFRNRLAREKMAGQGLPAVAPAPALQQNAGPSDSTAAAPSKGAGSQQASAATPEGASAPTPTSAPAAENTPPTGGTTAARWDAMTPEERMDFLNKTQAKAKARDRVSKQSWAELDASWQRSLERVLGPGKRAAKPVASPVSAPAPEPTAAPAPAPKAKKQTKAERERQEFRERLANYFQPGAIVKSYYGHDRVLALELDAPHGWRVQVESVTKKGDDWVTAPGERPRWHSTTPDLKREPVVRPASAAAPAPAPAAPTERVDAPPAPSPAPAEASEIASPASGNKVFTDEAAAAARARLRAKLGRPMSGVDPELLLDGITLAGWHVERGARKFATFAQAMLADLGETVRPYLKSWYLGVLFDPRSTDFAKDMSTAAFVAEFDLDAIATAKTGSTDAPAVESPAPNADTPPEASNDSTPPTEPPADDRQLAPIATWPWAGDSAAHRGAAAADPPAGRADDGGLRREDEPAAGADDAAPGLGDRAGDGGVPDGRARNLERDRERVLAGDYRAPIGSLTREGGWLVTARRNVDLIELAIKIQAEGRPATPEEQAQLAKYVGFGAGEIRNKLFPVPGQYARQQEPERLIWPNLVYEASWKQLAERLEKLPREWQQSVLKSTQYAHYTSENVVRSIWAAVQRLGFTGGKILEPGVGTGNFAMAMPESMRRPKGYTGIEMDGPTALIARLLSPAQNMLHEDFIKRKLPRDFFDLAIGNPPFAQTKILGDPDYEKFGFMLHDFFFAKTMDRVRPGGLLVFVTSKGTMDKQTDRARKYLMDRADLLGAIRLPSTAFEDNAGTSVVTDVIFLRKRELGAEPAGQKWLDVATIETPDGAVVVNEYYAANPEMVLGQQRISGNTDDEGRRINSNGYGGEKYTVVSYDKTPADLDAKFAAAVQRLPENVYSVLKANSTRVKEETRRVDYDPKVKREGVVYLDGKTLMRVESGVGKEMQLAPKDAEWMGSYVATWCKKPAPRKPTTAIGRPPSRR